MTAPAVTRAVAATEVRLSMDVAARFGVRWLSSGIRANMLSSKGFRRVGHALVGVEHLLFAVGQDGLDSERFGGEFPEGFADAGAGDDFPFGLGEREIGGGAVEFTGGLPEHHPGVTQGQEPLGLLDGGGVGVADL